MKDENDFSNAERGRFFRDEVHLCRPIYLDARLVIELQERASARGLSVSELVDELLKKSA